MKRITWTTMEIEQLTNITEHSRKFDKKIDWESVASQIPTRTASQCKSYYANVLKKTLDVPIRQNHQWNRVEIMSLWALGVNYDKDFAFIQKNYIPNMSLKQIQSQFLNIEHKQQEMHQTFKQIISNPLQIQNLSEKDFEMQWWIIRAAERRYKLIDIELNQIPHEDIPVSAVRADISEIKTMSMFFLDVKINDLIPIYKQEEIRRGLENVPFYVPKLQCSFRILNL
ncbi:Conserved_hypothetical protein [Hexamita inflata]|uniref:Myb-like DNA-binding domain-containing protein n=1 Tax=Hexamita inflata TaxID=28002 RepID=A0AA86UC73_9EUKA|nr:Conserved hypothetical protein [Hexamita inflata]